MITTKILFFVILIITFSLIYPNVFATANASNRTPIEVITHAGDGGGTDVNSRMLMLRARRELKQDMVIVNKRGGGGASAMNYFLSRPKDGNSILTFTVGHAITMAMGKTRLQIEDMVPLARGTNDPQILMVNCKRTPYTTAEKLVAGIKNGDKITFGGSYKGTIDHITTFLFAKKLGKKMPKYIPYRGGSRLAIGVVAGEVDVGVLNLAEAGREIDSGSICPLIILDHNKMASIPKAKTAISMGIDLVLSSFRGFVTSKGTPKTRIIELEKGISKAMRHSMYQAYLFNSGLNNKSPQPSKIWGEQIKYIVNEFGPALKEMGLINTYYKPKSKTTVIAENNNQTKYSNNFTQPKSTISSAELETERAKRIELERKLAALEAKQKQERQKINTDNQEPIINAFSKLKGSNAIISGRVTDNVKVAEVLIDGQAQKLSSNGTFETNFYIPRSGKTVEIVAFDIKGNRANKTLRIKRDNIQQASGPTFDTLNPSSKRVKPNTNALALIIGVADYAKTPANALYADKDAQQFYDYATMKLGIPSLYIKELVNDKADLGEILINVKEWLRRSAKPNESDIYIYFAGHGLASQDGTKMYLLPYDGRPRLLENTALLRDELFKDIKQANPKSVTVFLDTCYSGVTRNEEMLIAGRPIVIKAKEQAIPDGFTLFSAASNEQISRPLEEAKHGMFSYFLMKGMEGHADTNNDNKITARELHAYVKQNVVQQSSGSQTPELQGDKDIVLVKFK